MSDALQIFASEHAAWSDRTQAPARPAHSVRGSEGQQRLLALAAALGAWSLVAAVGALVWIAIG